MDCSVLILQLLLHMASGATTPGLKVALTSEGSNHGKLHVASSKLSLPQPLYVRIHVFLPSAPHGNTYFRKATLHDASAWCSRSLLRAIGRENAVHTSQVRTTVLANKPACNCIALRRSVLPHTSHKQYRASQSKDTPTERCIRKTCRECAAVQQFMRDQCRVVIQESRNVRLQAYIWSHRHMHAW